MTTSDTPPTGTVRSADGTAIAFDRTGSGAPLVIVDGAFCTRSFGPAPALAALLRSDFTVYTYDRRGRGESTDTQPYEVQREIQDLNAVIAEAGGSVLLFGSSSGGALALNAVAAGLDVTKLAVWEVPYSTDPAQKEAAETYMKNLQLALGENRRGDAVALFMTLVGNPPEVVAGMRKAPFWTGLEDLAHTLAYDATVLGDQSIPERMASAVAIPTLVLDGGASPESMRTGNKALAGAIAGAQYKTLPDQTHDVAADVICPALREFFTK